MFLKKNFVHRGLRKYFKKLLDSQGVKGYIRASFNGKKATWREKDVRRSDEGVKEKLSKGFGPYTLKKIVS